MRTHSRDNREVPYGLFSGEYSDICGYPTGSDHIVFRFMEERKALRLSNDPSKIDTN